MTKNTRSFHRLQGKLTIHVENRKKYVIYLFKCFRFLLFFKQFELNLVSCFSYVGVYIEHLRDSFGLIRYKTVYIPYTVCTCIICFVDMCVINVFFTTFSFITKIQILLRTFIRAETIMFRYEKMCTWRIENNFT